MTENPPAQAFAPGGMIAQSSFELRSTCVHQVITDVRGAFSSLRVVTLSEAKSLS
jgi:hypothetical protein